ncbi:putative UDP-N-acetylglucosamine transferase subunit ALG13-like protein [Hypsibius exemplaris]|uniref:UDP-N-acetylglucosamine transferase subunit ALG13 n=1 Tax=Hypsibius exemplaris TaxID=2072580 RepID=A0A1W0WSF8_HYPEX|nr:putative UDP-N-acetylglucosamine transferase subunit ALG13-like protein [Hypsibius exemplaris]
MDRGTVFATVGTTSFDELIEALLSDSFLQILHDKGYRKLVLQIGRGRIEPVAQETRCGVEISSYRLKPNIQDDLMAADLVISHAGAGSVLETLALNKRLLVVVNETLMGNHQTELAENFAGEGFLFWTTVKNLPHDFANIDWLKLKKYQPGRPDLFASYMDNFFGLS